MVLFWLLQPSAPGSPTACSSAAAAASRRHAAQSCSCMTQTAVLPYVCGRYATRLSLTSAVQAWRDAYALATILSVAARALSLQAQDEPAGLQQPASQGTAEHAPSREQTSPATAGVDHGQRRGSPSSDQPEALATQNPVADRLRDLDMALLMGGPRFRPGLHLALHSLQEASCSRKRGLESPSSEGLPAQRPRVQAQRAPAAVEGHARHQHPSRRNQQVDLDNASHSGAAVCTSSAQGSHAEPACADGLSNCPAQIQLPPRSLSDPGASIPTAHVPSLEHFLTSYMQPAVPVVVTGRPPAVMPCKPEDQCLPVCASCLGNWVVGPDPAATCMHDLVTFRNR